MSDPTPLYTLSKRIVGEVDRVISEKLMKWRMFSAQWKLEVEDYYGKSIHYSEIKFDGSPRVVFWRGFIEPFLENGIINSLTELEKICSERNLDINNYKNEMSELLQVLIVKAYNNMAETDQILRGNGNPKSVTKVNVSDKVAAMEKYLNNCLVVVSHGNSSKIENTQEIFGLKPNIYGFSIDLKVLWRKLLKLFNGT